MKLLLDENLPHRLRKSLPGHDVYTVRFMLWDGIGNGELLAWPPPVALMLSSRWMAASLINKTPRHYLVL